MNAQQVTNLDGQFHAVMYEASNSKILSHTMMDFHKYVQNARKIIGGIGGESKKIDPRTQDDPSRNQGQGCRSGGTACK